MINPNLTPEKKIYEKESRGGTLPIVTLPKPVLPNVSEGSASANIIPGYERGVFTPSGDYNSAVTNKDSASQNLAALGDAKWYYGTDAEGKPVLGDNILNGFLSDYQNRDKFTYDLNSDALYNQYKDQYITQGRLAMEDTMGQAAALTGGYGNSYAATVGNQAYQAYLGKLNEVIPELYQLAYDKYNQEGQDLLNKITLLRGERDNYYTRYNEDYNRAFGELDYWSNMANELYNRDYTAYSNDEAYKYNTYRDSVQDAKDAEQMAFAKQQYEDSKYVNAGGQYKVSKDSSGKPVVTPDLEATAAVQKTSAIPSKVVSSLQKYTTRQGQDDYLAKQVSAGIITQDQAYDLMDEYGVVPLNERTWEMVDNGGWNLFGIDDNAKVSDGTNTYTLKQLKKELKNTTKMSDSEIKKYLKDLQKQLGISESKGWNPFK